MILKQDILTHKGTNGVKSKLQICYHRTSRHSYKGEKTKRAAAACWFWSTIRKIQLVFFAVRIITHRTLRSYRTPSIVYRKLGCSLSRSFESIVNSSLLVRRWHSLLSLENGCSKPRQNIASNWIPRRLLPSRSVLEQISFRIMLPTLR
jgi:hypothetical protein